MDSLLIVEYLTQELQINGDDGIIWEYIHLEPNASIDEIKSFVHLMKSLTQNKVFDLSFWQRMEVSI